MVPTQGGSVLYVRTKFEADSSFRSIILSDLNRKVTAFFKVEHLGSDWASGPMSDMRPGIRLPIDLSGPSLT